MRLESSGLRYEVGEVGYIFHFACKVSEKKEKKNLDNTGPRSSEDLSGLQLWNCNDFQNYTLFYIIRDPMTWH